MTEKNSSYRRTRSRSSLFISSQFPMALHSTIEWKEQQRSIVWTSFLKKRHLFGDGPLNRGSRSSGATSNRKRVEERFVMKWCRSKFHPSSPRERERERESWVWRGTVVSGRTSENSIGKQLLLQRVLCCTTKRNKNSFGAVNCSLYLFGTSLSVDQRFNWNKRWPIGITRVYFAREFSMKEQDSNDLNEQTGSSEQQSSVKIREARRRRWAFPSEGSLTMSKMLVIQWRLLFLIDEKKVSSGKRRGRRYRSNVGHFDHR